MWIFLYIFVIVSFLDCKDICSSFFFFAFSYLDGLILQAKEEQRAKYMKLGPYIVTCLFHTQIW